MPSIFFHAALGQQRLDVVKIALDGGEVARRAEALRRRRQRVVVAVDAVEVPRAVQPTQNLRAVAAAAQRAVHIDAALAHVEHIHRGHEHHAHMFKIHRLSLSSLSTVLISPIRYSEPAQTTRCPPAGQPPRLFQRVLHMGKGVGAVPCASNSFASSRQAWRAGCSAGCRRRSARALRGAGTSFSVSFVAHHCADEHGVLLRHPPVEVAAERANAGVVVRAVKQHAPEVFQPPRPMHVRQPRARTALVGILKPFFLSASSAPSAAQALSA